MITIGKKLYYFATATTLASTLLAGFSISYFNFHEPRNSDSIFPQHTANIAHRGGSEHTPENTHSAFRKAAKSNIVLELDVMLSKDGDLVVIHDLNLERTTNGTGKVGEMTTKELLKLDAGSSHSDEFKEEKIPLLEDVFREYGDNTLFEIEIKSDNSSENVETIAKEFVRLVMKYKLSNRSIACSFNPFILQAVKNVNPSILRAQIYSDFDNSDLPWFQKIALRNLWFNRWSDPDILQVSKNIVDENYVQKYQRYGYQIHVWTVNDPKEMVNLISIGVDGIITDNPQLLENILKSMATEDDRDQPNF